MKHFFQVAGCAVAMSVGPVFGAATAAPAAAAQASLLEGKVVETMNAASYTYVQVETGGRRIWAAAPQFDVKVGDAVAIGDARPMPNYHSKTLNRTFDVVYFSGDVRVNGQRPVQAAAADLPAGHPAPGAKAGPAVAELSGIKKVADGQTVAEIYADKAQLTGKSVAVRGRVVKFNAMIMGKNWIHIRDGSGVEGANDLTVTTADKAKVGDVVVITGELKANRDFGGGYRYPLIVEDAKVAVE
ncbi:MAG: OB-fold nucleic acid binding domain-containing protein [Verrucomicrobiota bacterium]